MYIELDPDNYITVTALARQAVDAITHFSGITPGDCGFDENLDRLSPNEERAVRAIIDLLDFVYDEPQAADAATMKRYLLRVADAL